MVKSSKSQLLASETLFCESEVSSEISSLIETIMLSPRIVSRRVELIADKKHSQMIIDILRCSYFSL